MFAAICNRLAIRRIKAGLKRLPFYPTILTTGTSVELVMITGVSDLSKRIDYFLPRNHATHRIDFSDIKTIDPDPFHIAEKHVNRVTKWDKQSTNTLLDAIDQVTEEIGMCCRVGVTGDGDPLYLTYSCNVQCKGSDPFSTLVLQIGNPSRGHMVLHYSWGPTNIEFDTGPFKLEPDLRYRELENKLVNDLKVAIEKVNNPVEQPEEWQVGDYLINRYQWADVCRYEGVIPPNEHPTTDRDIYVTKLSGGVTVYQADKSKNYRLHSNQE